MLKAKGPLLKEDLFSWNRNPKWRKRQWQNFIWKNL